MSETIEILEPLLEKSEDDLRPPLSSRSTANHATSIAPQTGCGTCGVSADGSVDSTGTPIKPSFIYAIGRIEPRFPNLAAEKEFAQAAGRANTFGKTDRQTLAAVLSERENRYLLRQLCWVMDHPGPRNLSAPPTRSSRY